LDQLSTLSKNCLSVLGFPCHYRSTNALYSLIRLYPTLKEI